LLTLANGAFRDSRVSEIPRCPVHHLESRGGGLSFESSPDSVESVL